LMPFYRRTHSYRAQMEDFWGSIDGSAAEIRRALPEPRTQPNDQQRGRDGPRPTVQPARPTLDMTTLTTRAASAGCARLYPLANCSRLSVP